MTLSGEKKSDQCTMSFLEKNNKTLLGLVCSSQDGYKKSQKINNKYRKIIRLSKVARSEIQAFLILSSRTVNFLVAQSVFSL